MSDTYTIASQPRLTEQEKPSVVLYDATGQRVPERPTKIGFVP